MFTRSTCFMLCALLAAPALANPNDQIQVQGDRWTVTSEAEGETRRAVFELERRDDERIGRLLELEPDDGELRWLWRQLPPRVDLLLPGGERVAHPDRARAAAWARAAGEGPLGPTLAKLSELLRAESRGIVLSAAARRDALGDTDWTALLDALRHDGALEQAAPEQPLGGATADVVCSVLTALAGRADTGPIRGGQLADLAHRARFASYQGQVLQALVGKAPVPALLAAAERLGDADAVRTLFLALAGRELREIEANALAGATPLVRYASYQGQVLEALIGKASVGALLKAIEGLGDADTIRGLLLKLVRQDGLGRAEADAVAGAARWTRYASYQGQVLEALIGKASEEALLKAIEGLGDADTIRGLLLKLVRQDGLGRAEADALAGAARWTRYASYQGQVLEALIGKASEEALLKAIEGLGDADTIRGLLLKLVRQDGLGRAEADALAGAARWTRYASYQGQVLEALIGKASVEALLKAIEGLGDADTIRGLLLELARGDLKQAEADAVAGAARWTRYSSYQAQVLEALVGKASDGAVRDAVSGLDRDDRDRIERRLGGR